MDDKRIEKLIKTLNKPGREALKASTALADLGALAVLPLIHTIQENEDEYVRKLAALSLGRIGKPAIRPLLDATSDDNPVVRRFAIEALGKIKSEPAVLGALFRARKDPDEGVRDAAWRALERLPPPDMSKTHA